MYVFLRSNCPFINCTRISFFFISSLNTLRISCNRERILIDSSDRSTDPTCVYISSTKFRRVISGGVILLPVSGVDGVGCLDSADGTPLVVTVVVKLADRELSVDDAVVAVMVGGVGTRAVVDLISVDRRRLLARRSSFSLSLASDVSKSFT